MRRRRIRCRQLKEISALGLADFVCYSMLPLKQSKLLAHLTEAG